MCLVPGLADGRYLTGDLVPEDLVVGADCACGHHDGDVSRRQLLGRSALAVAGLALGDRLAGLPEQAAAAAPAAEPAPDRIVMLGVNGGPVLSAVHSQPSISLVVDNRQYLVDCGGDAARQIVNAKLGFASVRHVFLTHHHLDHVAGYPELVMLGWTYALSPLRKLRVWGPPPLARMDAHLFEMFSLGIEMFEVGLGDPPLRPKVAARQFSLPKRGIAKVMENQDVSVHATRVFHGPEVHDAYAYRFDTKRSGKSVVFSGDTAGPNRQLVALAKDADVLVHEAQMNSAIPQIVAQADPGQRRALTHHLEISHTNVLDLPKIAKEANVKRLVMCHYTPSFIPAQAFLGAAKQAAASVGFGGEIVAPKELDQIVL